MRIDIACGGTGGHVVPGLTVARVLRQRGHAVTLWLAGAAPEKDSLADWDGPVQRIRAGGFPSGVSLRAPARAVRLTGAAIACLIRMRRDPPAVLLAMGSYASVAPAAAARLLRVPLVLHEANAVPGRAVCLLARHAAAVALTFASAARGLPRARTAVTGFPVRRDLDGRFEDGVVERGRFTVLVMGGSQGSQFINATAAAAICRVHAQGGRLQVIHLAGRAEADSVRDRYRQAGVPHVVFPFLREIGKAYRAADLAISRAGAASCMELAACGLPCLLVPLPSARRDHQAANARELVRAGGADVMAQEELTVERLADYLQRRLSAPAALAAMRTALQSVGPRDGSERLADLVEASGHGREPALG